jgi:hypothetical protein
MKVISIDNGRAFNKSYCNGKHHVFQTAYAPIDGDFNLTVKGLPDDIWIQHDGREWLIGDLAVRQKPKKAIQDRDSNKINQQNIIQTLAACSFYANREDIVLLCNVPARDFSAQREQIKQAFKGRTHVITHKAGDLSGKTSLFTINDCHVLPEGECTYYGTVYDLNLRLVREDILNSPTLVIDIGDQTVNYVSFNPGGEPYDEGSGSLDLGMYTAYANLQNWLMRKGSDITQAELIGHIMYNKPLYIGATKIDYLMELQKEYSELERSIYNQLSALLSLKRYRFMILGGGGSIPLRPYFGKRYSFLDICNIAGAQLLNCYGAHIIYQLSRGAA